LNIFYLDESPVLAAQYQVNVHVIKMLLESAQLLSTTHHICPKQELPEKFYKKTHYNHPSAVWARESVDNYEWLCEHAMALCEEYTYRYGKTHASQGVIQWCCDNVPNLPDIGPTPVKPAMPDEYIKDDPVKSYRDYYFYDKGKNIKCEWKVRSIPYWWQDLMGLESLRKTKETY